MREGRIHCHRTLRVMMSILYSSVKSLAGPGGAEGALRDITRVGVRSRAVTGCVRCMRGTFLFRKTGQCGVGKRECCRSVDGCCTVSINLEGTHLGFQRRRVARVVRGVVCGRLHVHNFLMSVNVIRVEEGRNGGCICSRLRISFVTAGNASGCCVRSTCTVPARRGQRRRVTSLEGVSGTFHGVVVVTRSVTACASGCNVMRVNLFSFLLGRALGLT